MTFADHIESVDRATHAHLGGESVSYAPEVGAVVLVTGMFDERFVTQQNGEAGVEMVVPSVVLRLGDLPTHPRDDDPVLTILGENYTVRGRETDGVPGGSIRLLLRKQGM